MTNMRVLIADDEPLAVERHASLCARIAGLEVVDTRTVSGEVLQAVSTTVPDFVLLDISMPGLDGMALGKLLTALPNGPRLVFATAHNSYAVAAFELAAVDYLLKPIRFERLELAVQRVRDLHALHRPALTHLDAIWLPRGSQMVRLDIGRIELVEAERDYVRLHSDGRSFLLRGTIQAFEQRLDPAHFARVHRSAIVPVGRITSVDFTSDAWTILLDSGRQVRVGPSYRATLRRITQRH